MKILVFGGTFNPPHNGHVKLCKYLAQNIGVDKVIVIPAFAPVHKWVGNSLASAQDRINMCKLAFSQMEKCDISDIEILKNKACYTVDTLTEINCMYPDSEIYFACGSDMFLTLDSWKQPEKLFKLATFCALPRKNEFNLMVEKAKQLEKKGLKYKIFDADYIEISSTEVRRDIKENRFSQYVDQKVMEYILENNLYGVKND